MNTIVPVGVPHVGWVIELVVGIEGGAITKMLTKSLDAAQGEFEIVH